ncbi:MAG: sigma-70 family RNA polymerase sigma factor [Dysgonamonadaceae bacterium]|nr:sigma-70 family RNA polymerase sigma factor [Dysgonamonadaceae bacterium]
MDAQKSDPHELIAACKRRDNVARKKLYELYAPAMLGVCARYLGDKETARDILHEGFIKVFTKIDSFSGAGSFEGWLRKIFVTTTLEYLRSAKNWQIFDLSEAEEVRDNFSIGVIEQLSAEEILQCIDELPAGFKTVFNLYAIEGYSHAEIARMLHIQEASSRSQFARARQLLQTKIREKKS